MTNRSMPPGAIIPELAYPDVREAVDWLCRAYGFSERLQIGKHRAQLVFGTGSIIVTLRKPDLASTDPGHAVMVCVTDIDAHYEQATRSGAKITSPPADYPYGERQYSAKDPGGHQWIFSQTIADVNPQDWGGVLINTMD